MAQRLHPHRHTASRAAGSLLAQTLGRNEVCKLTELTGSPACAIKAGGGHGSRTALRGHVGSRVRPQQIIDRVQGLILKSRWVQLKRTLCPVNGFITFPHRAVGAVCTPTAFGWRHLTTLTAWPTWAGS